jgi:FKBP-type peptidyl-prolyl cis-trans isomerase SlyD
MKIDDNCVVSIHYTLTDNEGTTIDSSAGGNPLSYLHGHRALISGLERELAGREAGDALQVTVQPEEGYGPVDPNLIAEVPLDALSHIENLAVGMQLQGRSENGQVQNLLIESIDDQSATLNGNHMLAGKVLNFDVTVEGVREATAEELEHGHAH